MPDERHMDGGWGRFIRKPDGGQVWMWREHGGWNLNGVCLSQREVDADYEPAPLTILSAEARKLLSDLARGTLVDRLARSALASMGLGPNREPLVRDSPWECPRSGETWEHNSLRVQSTVDMVTDEAAWLYVPCAEGEHIESIRVPLRVMRSRWQRVREVDGSEAKR